MHCACTSPAGEGLGSVQLGRAVDHGQRFLAVEAGELGVLADRGPAGLGVLPGLLEGARWFGVDPRRIPALYSRTMTEPIWLPPQGFDDLSVEDQIEYVQSLWNRIAANADHIPMHDWQRTLLEERLNAHQSTPAEARPWDEVLDRLQRRLRRPG